MGPDFGSAPILVSPDATLSYWKPGLRSDLFDFAREFVKPGHTVWDIGANVGLFSVAAAHQATHRGTVVAVEADLWLAGLLRRSAALQSPGSASILVIPAAASDQPGIASFNIVQRGRASNYLADREAESENGQDRPVAGGIREQVPVFALTLDALLDLGLPAPHVLKIDVEGAEARVLQGANRILAESRPVILCEVWAKNGGHRTVTGLLARHRYRLYDWNAETRSEVELAAFNTLALPRP